jgi:Na+/H+ antiporter NhaD/arsenite permease-like protein
MAVAIGIFVGALAVIASERVDRTKIALLGATLVLLTQTLEQERAVEAIDWNTIGLLTGMMLMVRLTEATGVYTWLAIRAGQLSRGRPLAVVLSLSLTTAVLSAFLDNVTTVLLIAPVTFLVCERLGVPVAPFLIAEVMASNIGGTATLVGDPPNIIIASRGGLSYNDFLVHLAPFVVVALVVFILLCRFLFRSAFRYDPERAAEIANLRERDAIRDGRLLVVSLAVLAVVTVAFVLHTALHLEPAVVAIVGGLLLLAASRLDTGEVVKDVEWPTLAFFAGLFVMVGALVATGVMEEVSRAAVEATEGRLFAASMLLLWGSAVLSAIVDNIPYVATISPVVAEMVNADGNTSQSQVLWWSLALGADLGGNATAIGASANVVVLGIAERAGKKITFWEFTKYGLIVTAVTIALAMPYLWLRYFAFV